MSIFSNIAARRPQSSDFSLSHNRKFAFSPGRCIPTLCQEVLPSDKWNYSMSALVRFMPMQAPVMHEVDVYNYSFFVPARLTMQRSKFETFITGGTKGDGKDAQGNTIQIPFCTFNQRPDGTSSSIGINFRSLFWLQDADNNDRGMLGDFLGIGNKAEFTENNTDAFDINMMPFIAFWRIWNQYFRDQNLHPDYEELYPGIFDATGDITAAIYTAVFTNAADPLKFFDFFHCPTVCWEKDYFTSALPFAQRGNPVETPLSGTATVNYRNPSRVQGAPAGTNQYLSVHDATVNIHRGSDVTGGGGATIIDNIESVELESGGFTINQLRLSARLQEWLEKMARGGSRYIEQIRAHFGVTSSDARLQRPEFLAGGKIPVNISEVLQTSADDETTSQPLATMAGHGLALGNINSFSRFFEEHGFVISMMFLRPKPAYQQGIPRLFRKRFDKLDWAWPSFAHLGEQEINNEEIYFSGNPGTTADDDGGTFGYQARYSEYKYIPNTVHGDFKGNLNFWHWGEIYDARPQLNPEFVNCTPSARIFNVIDSGQNTMYCIVKNRIKARRPLPYFSQPAL